MTQSNQNSTDPRITQYIEITERLKKGDYDFELSIRPTDDIGRLGQSLKDLGHSLETHYRELQKLDQITSHINAGLLLDDVLDKVYHNFRAIIPYNRIGFALIQDENNATRIEACWARSDQPKVKLVKGYSAPLAGSSLETIMETGEPRIINDLIDYLEQKPTSKSTRLIVEEGMRSSLTCPLIANGIPVGFIFFSSVQPNIYADVHIDIFKRIAGQLSVIVEKGRLVSRLADQKTAIEKQNEELYHLNELKNTFLGIAAHDLRGPIGFIQMIGHLLADPFADLSEEEYQSLVADINQQTGYMLELLNDLLDVSQIEAGKLKLKLEPVLLDELLRGAVKRQAKMAAPKGTTVLLESSSSAIVIADSARLLQVIDNFISNAIKYSPPASKVTVGLKKEDAFWKVYVQDEGPGLTEKDKQNLFKNFSRLSAQPTGGEKSVGLGLAITRRVVEEHGGRIGVDSKPGKGANFWFILPASPDTL